MKAMRRLLSLLSFLAAWTEVGWAPSMADLAVDLNEDGFLDGNKMQAGYESILIKAGPFNPSPANPARSGNGIGYNPATQCKQCTAASSQTYPQCDVMSTLNNASKQTWDLGHITFAYCNDEFLVVHGDGLPNHTVMLDEIFKAPGLESSATGDSRTLETQDVTYTIPLNPRKVTDGNYADAPGMGAMGMSTTGMPIYPASSTSGQDTMLTHQNDRCNAHAGRGADYHYHGDPAGVYRMGCMYQDTSDGHSILIGFGADGFAIYGPYSLGKKLPDDLDECGAHKHEGYGWHYHTQFKFPWVMKCYSAQLKDNHYESQRNQWHYENRNARADVDDTLPCCGSQVFTGWNTYVIPSSVWNGRTKDNSAAQTSVWTGCRSIGSGLFRTMWAEAQSNEATDLVMAGGALTTNNGSSTTGGGGKPPNGGGDDKPPNNDTGGGNNNNNSSNSGGSSSTGSCINDKQCPCGFEGRCCEFGNYSDRTCNCSGGPFTYASCEGGGGNKPPPPPNGRRRLHENNRLQGYIYADNYFELYVNGEAVLGEGGGPLDTVEFVPHNAVRVDTEIVDRPDGKRVIAIMAKDFGDADTGLEYDNSQYGDGGLIAYLADSQTGEEILTGGNWKCKTLNYGPAPQSGRSCCGYSSAASVGKRCSGTFNSNDCLLEVGQAPSGWYESDFDDSKWDNASEYSADDVGYGRCPCTGSSLSFGTCKTNCCCDESPSELAAHGRFGTAAFIWRPNLLLDNKVICRYTYTSQTKGVSKTFTTLAGQCAAYDFKESACQKAEGCVYMEGTGHCDPGSKSCSSDTKAQKWKKVCLAIPGCEFVDQSGNVSDAAPSDAAPSDATVDTDTDPVVSCATNTKAQACQKAGCAWKFKSDPKCFEQEATVEDECSGVTKKTKCVKGGANCSWCFNNKCANECPDYDSMLTQDPCYNKVGGQVGPVTDTYKEQGRKTWKKTCKKNKKDDTGKKIKCQARKDLGKKLICWTKGKPIPGKR